MLSFSAFLLLLVPQSTPSAREGIVELLRSDHNEERGEACLRLKRLGPRAKELILELEADPELEVSLRAKDLLCSLDLLESIPWRVLDAYPRLAEAVVGSDVAAARVLEALGEQAEVLWLDEGSYHRAFAEGISLFQTCPDLLRKEDLETAAVAAFREVDSKDDKLALCGWASSLELSVAAPEIAALVQDPDPEVRFWALRALGELRADVGFGEMVQALEDPVQRVAEEAWDILRSLGPDRAVVPLVAFLARPLNPWMTVKVLRLLELSNSQAALPAVRRALQTDDSIVRGAATRALAALVWEDSFEELLELCSADCREIRRTALAEVLKLELPGSGEAALERLADPCVRVRQEALFGLARLGRKDAAPSILKLLDNPLDRQTALHALSILEAQDAIPAIQKYANDPDPYVRRQVALAMEKLRKP